MKYDTVPCQLTGIFGCKNTPTMSTLTNKTYSGKKPPTVTWGRSWVVIWVSGVSGNIPNLGSDSK
jgi:hypothetical protein